MRDCLKIVMIRDRSGSMGSCRAAMDEVTNGWLSLQKEKPGACEFTLVDFDDRYEEVLHNVPLSEVPHLSLNPRGNTALLDAIGRTVDHVGQELAALSEGQRPNKVLFVIITDGFENASREYVARPTITNPNPNNSQRVFDMVTHQREKYNWEFIFLGANQDAIATASGLGIAPASAVNFVSNTRGTKGMGARLNKMSDVYRTANTAYEGTIALQAANTAGGQTVTDAETKEWDDTMVEQNAKKTKKGTTK
jgi:hypothetical protein